MAFLNTLIMGVFRPVAALGVIVSIERCSQRMLFLASATVIVAAHTWIAMAVTLSASPWMVGAGFWLLTTGLALGLGPVTKVYLMEVFPTEVRSKGTGTALFVSRIVGFSITMAFPVVIDCLGVART